MRSHNVAMTWSAPEEIQGLVSSLARDLQSPYIDELLATVTLGLGDELVSRKATILKHANAHSYLCENVSSTLFKKCVDVRTSFDREAAALSKWRESENECYRSNLRLRSLNTSGLRDSHLSEFFRGARKIVEGWIGHRPPEVAALRCGFGPGATYDDRRALTTVADKMSSVPTLTPNAWAVGPLSVACTQWSSELNRKQRELKMVPGNRFVTVPKTAKTDRPIAIEPSLNVFVQLGLGREIRSRLKKSTGWDLTHAQAIHREVARKASVSRAFCTIDLESASDTVCKELVRLLTPREWFVALSQVRSPYTEFALPKGGSGVKPSGTEESRKTANLVFLEKFSSMGNGYTFELETLLFAAISCQVLRSHGLPGRLGSDVFVYGDDIIVPDDMYEPLCAVLKYCGFKVNAEKSFWGDIPFRESCGGDYLNGVDVRGIYLKEFPSDVPGLVTLHNQLHALSQRFEAISGVTLDHTLDYLASRLPLRNRLWGPEWLGDAVLHGPLDRWVMKRRGNRLLLQTTRKVPESLSWGHWTPGVQLACATLGYGDGRSGVVPRDAPFSVELRWVEVARLPN